MKITPHCLTVAAILVLVCFAAAVSHGDDSATIKRTFANPPRQYSSSPLWVWNDMLTEEQIVGSLRDLAGQKVKQVFVHPRPGLMTPYLSPEWFRLWKIALREAERLDMNVWIYDENSYPSGFAGGWVPELMPEARGRGLEFREESSVKKPGPEVLGVYRPKDNGFENVIAQARSGDGLPTSRYLVAHVVRAPNRPWNGNRCYVDLMYPGVTEKFLDVTLGAYQREIGSQFGKRVLGSFTDEPNVRPAGGLPWTEHLPQEFKKRWGYDLLDHLPSLVRPVGPWKQVRHDYFQVVLEQFIEHWAKPYRSYCEKLGIAFTGHYWDHDWPECIGVTDNMAMYAWEHIPGIDCLMNQYREDTRAQFGNFRMPRELSSVANQLGCRRRLCELYGAGGWDLRFEDMKRIGDWLEVLGVNLLDEHLSYVTLRGARKADHPQSFSYHEPWWDSYHVVSQYFTRQTAAISQGEQINRILVLEPTTTAWMYQADPTQAAHLKQLGDSFFNFLKGLERAHVEYDLGCEDIIARHGSIDGKKFRVGRRAYDLVVIPPMTETLNARTMELLEAYRAAAGGLLIHGEAPALVDGRPSQRGQVLALGSVWIKSESADLTGLYSMVTNHEFEIRSALDDKGILFHQRRQLDDGELVLLVNTSIDHPSRGVMESRRAKGVEEWNCRTGEIAPLPFTTEGGRARIAFDLPPCGSRLLFLSSREVPKRVSERLAHVGRSLRDRQQVAERLAPKGPVEIRRVEPNVLNIDYVDVTAGGQTRKGLHFYHANQMAFEKNGMERNPWDSAVQFKDELITKKFPPESGFSATYRFTIEGETPKPLEIVIERPDLYKITCNGKPVVATKDAWWLDKAFGRIDITAAAKPGANAVTIHAAPMTIYHELEPAYVLGDFSLKPAPSGFVIAPPKPLSVTPRIGWNQQGHPFYAAGVSYGETFEVAKPSGRYRVAVPSWYGSVAKVLVNGKLCGHLVSQPWTCDVTEAIRPGANRVEVLVVGTLKNTLGPHHNGSAVGSAWPSAFHNGPVEGPPPGDAYHTLAYGLFEPFTLEHTIQ